MLTAILLIGVSLIACARARADKLFQGIPINSNTCQAHRKRSVQSKVLNIVLFLIALFFIFIYLFFPPIILISLSYFILMEGKNSCRIE